MYINCAFPSLERFGHSMSVLCILIVPGHSMSVLCILIVPGHSMSVLCILIVSFQD
jgi:hypothetical protein